MTLCSAIGCQAHGDRTVSLTSKNISLLIRVCEAHYAEAEAAIDNGRKKRAWR